MHQDPWWRFIPPTSTASHARRRSDGLLELPFTDIHWIRAFQMTRLTLELALRVIDGALGRATELGCAPLTVVVLDAGGHDIALQRQDASGILRVDIARGKAWGALGMGFSSREIADRAQKVPSFVGALASVAQGRLVPAAGVILIRDEGGVVVGAVGISGDTSDRDEDCAMSGV